DRSDASIAHAPNMGIGPILLNSVRRDTPRRSGPDLHVGRALAVRRFAEVGVVVLDQRLQMIGLLEALERGLAGKLVHRHVLEFVLAQDFLVAPRADRAVEL